MKFFVATFNQSINQSINSTLSKMAISWSADTQHLQETYFRRTKSTKVVQASVSTKLCTLERVKKNLMGPRSQITALAANCVILNSTIDREKQNCGLSVFPTA